MPQHPTERSMHTPDGIAVRVLRSTRRRRTVSGVWKNGEAVISVPATLSLRQEDDWIERMVPGILARRAKALDRYGKNSDEELMQRAGMLNRKYLDGKAEPLSVRWVRNQTTRWGSASPGSGAIRLNQQLQGMPMWVQDYVLIHELAHLIANDGHGPQFKAWEGRYGRRSEAKAYLAGVSFGMSTRGGTGAGGSIPDQREQSLRDDPRDQDEYDWWEETPAAWG
ncbi:M48 family metallopeptidase [Arthrobacter rhombi]|uniref:M48 metallopeptidase family protein n=1 Tax=Arthrobacter rhombi TaxID=71253 RepID=UPI0031DE8068